MRQASRVVSATARHTFRDGVDFARLAIVLACAGALILAGQALPF